MNMASPASPVHTTRIRVEPGWTGVFEVLAAWFLPGRLELISGTESNLFPSGSESQGSKRRRLEEPNLSDSTCQVRC